jgi:hypothetical protein
MKVEFGQHHPTTDLLRLIKTVLVLLHLALLDKNTVEDTLTENKTNLVEELLERKQSHARGELETDTLQLEILAPLVLVVTEIVDYFVLVELENPAYCVRTHVLELQVFAEDGREVVGVYTVHLLYYVRHLRLVTAVRHRALQALVHLIDGHSEIVLTAGRLVVQVTSVAYRQPQFNYFPLIVHLEFSINELVRVTGSQPCTYLVRRI